jgi:hypothetical protein
VAFIYYIDCGRANSRLAIFARKGLAQATAEHEMAAARNDGPAEHRAFEDKYS